MAHLISIYFWVEQALLGTMNLHNILSGGQIPDKVPPITLHNTMEEDVHFSAISTGQTLNIALSTACR
jgi:hypothetical protein